MELIKMELIKEYFRLGFMFLGILLFLFSVFKGDHNVRSLLDTFITFLSITLFLLIILTTGAVISLI